ncbi:hypothetical protein DICPUDRAFT_149442 [Dictyostelium purpureum]|uniref:Uncharacterized protein n=1 Tax=Dictyostelium purpureum TaxID=5786 RepID=F0ZDR4_DICPU|nr:uncharacterized protein DICPUDRAFT_149442 [Dictyostelium purpureum]EGC37912.1 hypothetical protein DICPUDRAFT_149442 [Dictyostelium purpureum]|eukprot:XP_003285572.1 hypothetical protein DICPUDRAFT_149442 [Dictyostelium purpureum]
MKFLICLLLIITWYNNLVQGQSCADTLNNLKAFQVNFIYSGQNTSNPFNNYVERDDYFFQSGTLIVDRVNNNMYVNYQFDTDYSFESWLYTQNNTYYILTNYRSNGCIYRFTPNVTPITNYTDAGVAMVGSIKSQILSFETPNEFDAAGLLYVDPNDCSPIFQNGKTQFGNSLVTFTNFTPLEPSMDYFDLPDACAHAHLIV